MDEAFDANIDKIVNFVLFAKTRMRRKVALDLTNSFVIDTFGSSSVTCHLTLQ